ncbi:unnamed protein product [Mytilus coruscus]|uniref:Uncharacterized protein n=1 Tax=Mytilus coruscus TaxID=42192 RepID=A0A6J8DNV8_MYTCO|nr:unnamed protein product [Mytilus coruscus]
MFSIDHSNWIDPRGKCLYEHLVQVVGSEIDIRKRQRSYIIQDRIVNSSGLSNRIQIFSGSLAEGFDSPGSDMDAMYVMTNCTVIHNVKDIKNPNDRNMLVMETDLDHPGFARLRKVSAHNIVSLRKQRGRCSPSTYTGTELYLSIQAFLDSIMRCYTNMQPCIHGPCISNKDQTVDFAYCIRSKYLPYNAISWATRH